MGEDVSRLSAGMEVLRLSAEEQDARRRHEKRVAARGNLAALLVDKAGGLERVEADKLLVLDTAAEFAELCEALGLDPAPEGAPGICARPACTNEVPLHAAMRANEHQRRGFCSNRCMHLSYLPRAKDVE